MSTKAAAKVLFETLKAGKEFGMVVMDGSKAEMSRLRTQGSMELASALFSGQGFVPYGPGQYTPSQEQQQQQQRGMER